MTNTLSFLPATEFVSHACNRNLRPANSVANQVKLQSIINQSIKFCLIQRITLWRECCGIHSVSQSDSYMKAWIKPSVAPSPPPTVRFLWWKRFITAPWSRSKLTRHIEMTPNPINLHTFEILTHTHTGCTRRKCDCVGGCQTEGLVTDWWNVMCWSLMTGRAQCFSDCSVGAEAAEHCCSLRDARLIFEPEIIISATKLFSLWVLNDYTRLYFTHKHTEILALTDWG